MGVTVPATPTSQVLFTENVTDADNAFQSVLNEALAPTITGHTYYIEVTTVFKTALLSVALGRMVVDFESVPKSYPVDGLTPQTSHACASWRSTRSVRPPPLPSSSRRRVPARPVPPVPQVHRARRASQELRAPRLTMAAARASTT